MSSTHDKIIQATRNWVSKVVIHLNLCPFAKPVQVKDLIRFSVSGAQNEAGLLNDLKAELMLLCKNSGIETTLLIHPDVLTAFEDYNQFLDSAETLLSDLDLEGVFQIASFHPEYQFHGTGPEDAENYTNRSPFPMLHILREDSISNALVTYTNPEHIPDRNIALLNHMGRDRLNKLFMACFEEDEDHRDL